MLLGWTWPACASRFLPPLIIQVASNTSVPVLMLSGLYTCGTEHYCGDI